MFEKEEILEKCGLTKNESKIYLSLIRLGNASASEVAKGSGVHRVNAYDVLEKLKQKGLISTVMQSNKTLYEAASPKQLIKNLEEKEMLLKEIMPHLEQEFKGSKEKQEVHHFFGPEGVLQAYYLMLDRNDTMYAIGASGLNRSYLKHRHKIWDKERIKRKINVKALCYEFTRKEKTKEKYWENRFLANTYRTIGMVDICGNLIVNLIPKEGEIMAIVIENKALAESYKQFFRFMWKYAKP